VLPVIAVAAAPLAGMLRPMGSIIGILDR